MNVGSAHFFTQLSEFINLRILFNLDDLNLAELNSGFQVLFLFEQDFIQYNNCSWNKLFQVIVSYKINIDANSYNNSNSNPPIESE